MTLLIDVYTRHSEICSHMSNDMIGLNDGLVSQ